MRWIRRAPAGALIALLVPGLASAQADHLEELCDEVEEWVQAGPVAVGDLQPHRGPFDFEGTRFVGCFRNDGDAPLAQVMLEFDWVVEDGSGGATRNVELPPLDPGESMPFATDEVTNDPERYEERGATGFRLTGVNVLEEGVSGRPEHEADPAVEVPLPVAERPDHELEAACAQIDPAEGEGEVWISQAELAEVAMPGVLQVIGCVTNRGDELIADGMRTRVTALYEGEAGDGPGEMSMVGGQGGLKVAEPIEPGESAHFVSSFEFTRPVLEVEVAPAGMVESDEGVQQMEPIGPGVVFEREN